jgi:polyisoprenoid-binding protein YceI
MNLSGTIAPAHRSGFRRIARDLSLRGPALAAGLRNPLLSFFLVALLFSAQPTHAQETIVTLDAAQTRIDFTLGATMHTVHGTFKLKSGEIRFDPGTGKASGQIVVDAISGESGNESRDKKMHADYLESQKFAEIVFTPAQVKGALNPHAASQVEVLGTFRLHGSEHDFTLNVTVQPGTDKLEATTKFTIPYVKWGIRNPSTFILRVSDKVDVAIHTIGNLRAPAR